MKRLLVILLVIMIGMVASAVINPSFGFTVSGSTVQITSTCIDFQSNGNTLKISIPDTDGTVILECKSNESGHGSVMYKFEADSSYSNYNIASTDRFGLQIPYTSGAMTLWVYASGMSATQHLYIYSIQYVIDGVTYCVLTKK